MKKIKKGFLILFGVIVVLLIVGKIALGKMVDEVREIPVSLPDLSGVPNGNYVGEYTVGPVYVKVEVAVDRHQITGITILQHDNGLGSAAEPIVDEVIAAQSLDIDAVSGATVSSKCILKAIEDAIKNAVENAAENV